MPPSLDGVRDVEALRRAVARGAKAKFVFFWSHRPQRAGVLCASSFSQWYTAPFELEGVRYPTAEHFMMASKARLFQDREAERRILDSGSPGAAKAVGREVRGFDETTWTANRFGIAVAGNMAKFSQNSDLGSYLVGTSRRVIAEASPVDRIWGIGLEANAPKAHNPVSWRGLNLLGFALMEVRARISAT